MTGHEVEFKVSLDNITVVGTPILKGSKIRALLISLGFVNQHWMTPFKRYHDNYTLIGGGLLQVTHDTGFYDKNKNIVHQVRLEFNPNRIYDNSDLMHEYLKILKLIEEPRITRKDVAIDLMGIDMNDWIIMDYSSRKRVEYKSANMELETLYFGSKHSDVIHRIYNKALEQGLMNPNSAISSECKWWRVEAQIRRERAEMTNFNAFSKVRIVSKQDFLHHDIRERAMLYYLQANPDALHELSKNARSKYKKLLGEQIEHWFIDIEGMAEEAKKNLQADIESWLNFCPKDNRMGFKVKKLPSCLTLPEEKEDWKEWEGSIEGALGKIEDVKLVEKSSGREDWEHWVEQTLEDGEED